MRLSLRHVFIVTRQVTSSCYSSIVQEERLISHEARDRERESRVEVMDGPTPSFPAPNKVKMYAVYWD